MDEVVDVPYEGVVSWLLCRRLLPEDYYARLKGMTAHIRSALENPPETPEAVTLIEERKGLSFGYNEVTKLVEILAKDGGSDSLFSKAFGTASYRQWRRLQRTFQQQNLHLAEMSRALCTATNGTVPSHQKLLQQKQRLVSECIKKQEQLQEASLANQKVYEQLCAKYGLDAAQASDPLLVQQQLQVYVHRKLPERLRQAERLLRETGAELLAFYQSFAAYSRGERLQAEPMLPLLALVSRKGNVSLEVAAAAAPDCSLLQQQLQHQRQQEQQQQAAEAAAVAQIEIQQEGVEEDVSKASAEVYLPDEESVQECSSNSSSSSSNSNSSSSSSKLLFTDSLLTNVAVRRQLLLELKELQAFVYSRISQSAPAANSGSTMKQQQQQLWSLSAFLPQELQKDEKTLLQWQQCVEDLQMLLGGAETLELLELLQSDEAFSRVLERLLAARAQVQKPLSAHRQQKNRQTNLQNEVAAAAAALEKQRKELQQLLRLLEESMALSIRRRVRITGIPRDRLP